MNVEALVARVPDRFRAAVTRACTAPSVVAEACWHRDDPAPEIVIGLPDARAATLRELARAVVPTHDARIEAWLAATPDVQDVGFKLGEHTTQLYVRAHLTAATVAESFAAAQVDVQAVVIRNFLALLEQPIAVMTGLEIEGEAIDGALYTSVLRTASSTPALRDAFALLVRIVAPDQLDLWHEAARTLLASTEPELVYVSIASTLERPWVKIDVARRPLPVVAPLCEAMLGVRGERVLATAATIEDSFSHVGVRFGGGMGPTFYARLHGDRDE